MEVAHFSIAEIDALLLQMLNRGDIQEFTDVFFGEHLTVDPKKETWLKLRIGKGSRELSFKTTPTSTPADGNSIFFTLLTDEDQIKQAIKDLGADFETLEPFLTLFVRRVSICLPDGTEFWVDSARIADNMETRTIAQVLHPASTRTGPSYESLPSPIDNGEGWFVSAGYRGGRVEDCNDLFGKFAITNITPSKLFWVPSKAYYFQGLAEPQALNNGIVYDRSLHQRALDPLDPTGMVLSPTSPDAAKWLMTWGAAFNAAQKDDIVRELTAALDALCAANKLGQDRAEFGQQLYALPVNAFVDHSGSIAPTSATLYHMLHLWESDLPVLERLPLLNIESFKEDLKKFRPRQLTQLMSELMENTALHEDFLEECVIQQDLHTQTRVGCMDFQMTHAASLIMSYFSPPQFS